MWIDDDILNRCAEPLALACWIPAEPAVVLGSSNRAELEADVEACAADGVPILKRYGGGGTVLLYDGCVVVSVGAWVAQQFQNTLYFRLLNQALIDCLAAHWPACNALSQRGISDLAHGEQKVAGTSLFRSRNYLLYQASILVHADAERIARYLRHPTREPDYRRGRSHGSFLGGLSTLDSAITPAQVASCLQNDLADHLKRSLGAELVAPEPPQFASLVARANTRTL